jgi:hypothetical protein
MNKIIITRVFYTYRQSIAIAHSTDLFSPQRDENFSVERVKKDLISSHGSNYLSALTHVSQSDEAGEVVHKVT